MDTRTPLASAFDLCLEHNLIPRNSTVLCAVSGGADSVCLFHWLTTLRTQIPFTLVVAHYNHNLRGDHSRRDAEFVRELAQPYCPVILGSGDVAGESARRGTGIEQTARDLRYAFLQQTALQVGADVIATAHNANDNAETMLLNLMRGCGLNGLDGIPLRRDNIIRPLLTTTRENIEEYLRIYNLPHVEDETNTDLAYSRNWVRHQLLPLMEQFQPQFIRHMTHAARLLRQDEEYLCQQAQQVLSRSRTLPHGIAIDASAIADLPDPLAARAVQLLWTRLTGSSEACCSSHLFSVIALCRTANPSARVNLPMGVLARRVYADLELVCPSVSTPFTPTSLPLPGAVRLSTGLVCARPCVYDGSPQTRFSFYLSREKAVPCLTLRPRHTGDRLYRPGRVSSTVKKLMIDEKIPLHLRDTLPIVDCEGLVAAVVGLGPDQDFLPLRGEECWHITFTPSYTERKSST